MHHALSDASSFAASIRPARAALGAILARQKSGARIVKRFVAYAVVTALLVACRGALPGLRLFALAAACLAPIMLYDSIARWLRGRRRATRFEDAIAYPASIERILVRSDDSKRARPSELVVVVADSEASASVEGVDLSELDAALAYLHTIAPHVAPRVMSQERRGV